MRVLGKCDLENAILFDDLKALLEVYGMPADDQEEQKTEENSSKQQDLTTTMDAMPTINETGAESLPEKEKEKVNSQEPEDSPDLT
mmetsp:Transcript_18733/g.22133  ORF Transcript_18733/g.22133 Transcript_18733/m.22133 type:complete len:86 (-) Transcript_18733:688-945(-)|eukprot:CAMPEP_0185606822 /NCGR_PEP_ID=MMETSP0436-20130131/5059_1 /TAXON_ID=626734 ORGANISM="Favella taraikaensis, Strain Fe Narragansett Bay" /NCGR_SAMPLE_ID=MMETSP0436 /ASSEMBLY_ACC=CAM_ASM_000390 /LENGTH=85 /DNA_ID=CAMNT_0028238529 /DNA_START=507 /DNA_END=764 /DNA_ORIENTATION=+